MPSQQAEVAELITALSRKRDREKRGREGSSTKPIYSATNRGNKLYRGADHVRSGVLAYTYGPERYKEKIDHAGYSRYIVERNPPRYDDDGNELGDSDEDEAAGVDAAEQNPYSGILLEELLCPLKHPSELATHPTLSKPFLDPALAEMVRATEKKLQQERVNLWRAKNLNRQFIGDLPWMPCSTVEEEDDWDLFAPRPSSDAKRRRLGNDNNQIAIGEVDGQDYIRNYLPNGETTDAQQPSGALTGEGEEQVAEARSANEGERLPEPQPDSEHASKGEPEDVLRQADPPASSLDGEQRPPTERGQLGDSDQPMQDAKDTDRDQRPTEDGAEDEGQTPGADSPPQPTRRITRALAANTNGSNAPTPPLSPTSTLTDSSSSSLLRIDPLFLAPSYLNGTASSTRGSQLLAAISSLPREEAQDIRKLLTMYIQKQEESVRGCEAVLGKLIKAKRMREDVLEMCKAEGHVGEMSDGEDWIDSQRWELTPGELKKGKDEDDEAGEEREVTGIGGRKGKRRRNQ